MMAAKMHEFPVVILKMCMSMDAAPRRIRWADTYSFAVAVGQGVLPGCTAAMYLLQLVMNTPFDVFVSSTSHIP
eukprot:1012308-Pyramimonas_sp.AAC.1